MTSLADKAILSGADNQAIQADCDVKATNIILQGLPPEVYALVSTHKVAKELWKRIQMLMQGTSLIKQEREYKLPKAMMGSILAHLGQPKCRYKYPLLVLERVGGCHFITYSSIGIKSHGVVLIRVVFVWISRGNDDETESSRPKRSRKYKTMEEVLLPQVHHEFLEWEGCNIDAKSRYNTNLAHLLPRHIYSSCVLNWDILNKIGCGEEIHGMLRINLCEAGTNEEIFNYVAWIRAFNINEPIYSELCHEFYSTYEFDVVCADDELGLYHAGKLDEEGFDVYFQGGLHSDEHFNAQEYWLSISREEN
nr:retrotransposon Orf1 [Tanacetum cinerariifolium]